MDTNLNSEIMKKLCVIALVFFVSLSVNAKKTDRVFIELTKTMQFSVPVETVKYQNVTASYWRIPNGGFYYITSGQEFCGKYKNYNFTATNKTMTFLGVTKKQKRHVKKHLISDIISSREP